MNGPHDYTFGVFAKPYIVVEKKGQVYLVVRHTIHRGNALRLLRLNPMVLEHPYQRSM